MNSVELIGRLTKDPEIRYTAESQLAVATFTLAIDRPKKKDQEKADADFPRVTVFGKQAGNVEKYVGKGNLIAVEGAIRTGSYKNKNGDTVYTTDVVASRVEFLEFKKKEEETAEAPEGFEQLTAYEPF